MIPYKLFIWRFLPSQLFVGWNTLATWQSGEDANVEGRERERRGRKDGGSGGKEAESLEEEENRERGHGFMMCGKGKWPSLSLSSWLFSRLDLLPETHTHTRGHTQTHTHMCLYKYIRGTMHTSSAYTHSHLLSLLFSSPLSLPVFFLCRSPCSLASLSSSQSWKPWIVSRRNSSSSRRSITGTQAWHRC